MLNGPSPVTETPRRLVGSSNHRAAARLCVTLCWLQGPSDRLAMSLKALTDDEKSELKEQFTVLDKEESGFINLSELKEALDLAGFKVCLYIYTVSKQYLQSILSAARPQLRLHRLQRRAPAAPHTHHLSILLRGEFLNSSYHI